MHKGIKYVNDLVNDDGGFLSYVEFKKIYNLNMNVMDYYSLLHSIARALEKVYKSKVIKS